MNNQNTTMGKRPPLMMNMNGTSLGNSTAPSMLRLKDRYSETQMNAIVYGPKATAVLSIIGSSLIIYELLVRDRRRIKLRSTYHRIILAMSFLDLCSSIWLFVGSWAVPSSRSVPGANGNNATCSTQGFFFQLGIAVPLYNVSLSMYSLLVVRFRWTESRVKASARKFLLGVPILFGLGTAIAGVILDLFHLTPLNNTCWINNDKIKWMTPAERFESITKANNFKMGFGLAPIVFALTAVILFMGIIIRRVWVLEHTSGQWDFRNSTEMRRDRSSIFFPSLRNKGSVEMNQGERSSIFFTTTNGESASPPRRRRRASQKRKTYQVFYQATFFVLAFSIVWVPFLFYNWYLISADKREIKNNFAGTLLVSFLLPLQGFLNALVFYRPHYIRFREAHPKRGMWSYLFQRFPSSSDGGTNSPKRKVKTKKESKEEGSKETSKKENADDANDDSNASAPVEERPESLQGSDETDTEEQQSKEEAGSPQESPETDIEEQQSKKSKTPKKIIGDEEYDIIFYDC